MSFWARIARSGGFADRAVNGAVHAHIMGPVYLVGVVIAGLVVLFRPWYGLGILTLLTVAYVVSRRRSPPLPRLSEAERREYEMLLRRSRSRQPGDRDG